MNTSSETNAASHCVAKRRQMLGALIAVLILLSACTGQQPVEPPQQTPLPAQTSTALTPESAEPTVIVVTEIPEAGPTTELISAPLTLITETVTLTAPQRLRTTDVIDRPLQSVRALTDGSRKYKLAQWSPGAEWIAATPQDGPGLDAINVGSGEVLSLVTDTFVLEPVWLDADTLLVHREAIDGDQLAEITLTEQGSTLEPLITSAPPLQAIGANDGIVSFVAGEQLHVQHRATAQEFTLPLPALITAPAPRHEDGPTIAINGAITNLESISTALLHITREQATITSLSNPDEALWLPRWSADGNRLALTSIEGRIVTSSRDGSQRFDLGPGDLPTWSPDGSRIAYAGTSAGLEFLDRDIHLVDWQGQEPRLRLTDANDEQFFTSPSWSPDGSRIAFVEIDDGKIYVGTLPPR